jgi:hypothetical protein
VIIETNVQLGVIGSILDFGDLDAPERSAHSGDESFAEVVGERALAFELAHLDDDRFCFCLADPDREKSLTRLFPEYYDVGVVRSVEPESHYFAFDKLHSQNVTRWYACGSSVTLAFPLRGG